jgi:hypothetical protein
MLIFSGKTICVLAVSFCLIGLPMMQTASAAIISTETAIEMDERQGRIEHINDVLARESIQQMMVRFGVDPADASGRVAALTDTELQTLEQQLEQLPAGGTGVVEVIGIVAIVLVILELLGVTNFFSEF